MSVPVVKQKSIDGGDWQKSGRTPSTIVNGRRQWTINGTVINDPHWDGALFRGIGVDGAPESVPWSLELMPWIVASIPGWMTLDEGQTLFSYAQGASHDVVEIGRYCGLSGSWLGWGVKSGGHDTHLWCIDTFKGNNDPRRGSIYEQFRQSILYAGVDDVAHVLMDASQTMGATWDRPIGLLFIDGEHSCRRSRGDFDLFSPSVVPGGIVIFHDCRGNQYPGIRRTQSELAQLPNWRAVSSPLDNLGVWQKQ